MFMRSLCLFALTGLLLFGCATTSHPTEISELGRPTSTEAMTSVLDVPGPLTVETVVSTRWAVTREGLIDLDHPKAKAAGLDASEEPIDVMFHAIRHPQFGTFLIDTGVERALRDAPERAAVRGLVARELHVERMDFAKPLGDWLDEQNTPVAGVFLTHLHLDHVSGAPDPPRSTAPYTGPGDASARTLLNLFTRSSIDRALAGLPPLREWPFRADADERFAGIVDVFGDASFFAIWTPGHTPGSTAYLARTAEGPVLFTGDTSHTRWGWENEVPPGTFTNDHEENGVSLRALRTLVQEHPNITVQLGHQ